MYRLELQHCCVQNVSANSQMNDKVDLVVTLTLIVLPISVAFKAYSNAAKKYTTYQKKHAQILVNSTAATDKGALSWKRFVD